VLRWWLAIAGALLVTACASGAAVRLPPAAVGPAPADAQLVVTLRQPLVSDVMTQLDSAGALPSQLTADAAALGRTTERIVLSLLPARRGAVLALVPRTDYPAELIGWHLNVSDLQYLGGGGSGVRHYWSDPDIGFGILVFPNLIFSFWLDPYDFAAGSTEHAPGPAVREMIRIAREGSSVPLHPTAAQLSEAHLFAYLQDVAGFAAELGPATPNTARAMARLPADAAWAAGELVGLDPDDPVELQAGVALRADDLDPYLALIRLLVVTLLVQLDLLDAESLRGVQVGEGTPGTIAVTGLQIPRQALVEVLGAVVGGEDGTP
jgi:hypothetical protein